MKLQYRPGEVASSCSCRAMLPGRWLSKVQAFSLTKPQ